MVVQRSRFSASLIGLGFALFVGLHPQPNHMGVLIHQSAGVMLIVYASPVSTRDSSVCAKALYYASYLFFYGQNGFMVLYGGTKGGTGEEMPEMNGGEEMKGVEAHMERHPACVLDAVLGGVDVGADGDDRLRVPGGTPRAARQGAGGWGILRSPSKGNAGDGRRDVEAEFGIDQAHG